MHIGDLIRHKAKEKGITQDRIAEILDLKPISARKMLNRADIETDKLMKLSVALQYDFFMHYSALIPSYSADVPAPNKLMIKDIADDFKDFVTKAEERMKMSDASKK